MKEQKNERNERMKEQLIGSSERMNGFLFSVYKAIPQF